MRHMTNRPIQNYSIFWLLFFSLNVANAMACSIRFTNILSNVYQ